MLDVFDATESCRTMTHATTEKATFFMNPAHTVKSKGVSAWNEVVSFRNLNKDGQDDEQDGEQDQIKGITC